ncbi:MAG: nickel-dependent hydrogenase large subunit [Candidatus Micrarchaeia archaeon]
MHEDDFDISFESISKIEGHAGLDIRVRNKRVEDVRLRISENKRFYTQAIRGKPFNNIPQLVSRICGTCSIAHLTCCTHAVENALGIERSEQTMALRKLAMYGANIRDHAMHLFFFVLPDIVGRDSVLDFSGEKEEEYLRKAFRIKGVGNRMSKLIAGRAVHAMTLQLGGFSKVPSKEEAKTIVSELRGIRDDALSFLGLFAACPPIFFERTTNFVCTRADDFSYSGVEIVTSLGTCIPEENYFDHLYRVVIPYSQATGFEFEGRDYMVGALARMNLNRHALHPDTKRDCAEWLKIFPSKNVCYNNLAQAIEVIHAIDHSIELLEGTDFKPEPQPKIEAKESIGTDAIEAPRGTLFYSLKIGADGKIRDGTLVIPTQQNQVCMALDIKKLVEDNLAAGRSKAEIERMVEVLIRAYDPCMSCASHFLRVRWL